MSSWQVPYVRCSCIGDMDFASAGVCHTWSAVTCQQNSAAHAAAMPCSGMPCLSAHTLSYVHDADCVILPACQLACSRRPTAQAMYWPSGLKRAAATGFLNVKWCSSARRSRLISRLRPSSSIDSSSWPFGLTQMVRTCGLHQSALMNARIADAAATQIACGMPALCAPASRFQRAALRWWTQ